MELYADIIIDISHATLDRTFQYRVPYELKEKIRIGSRVKVPFGTSRYGRYGYIVGLGNVPKIEKEKIKDIMAAPDKELPVESRLIELAGWIKNYYGGTMIAALNTVTPVKQKVRKTAVRKEIRDYIRNLLKVENLNDEQKSAIMTITEDFRNGERNTYLLKGVTGSGKTEVYINAAKAVIEAGKQVIVLVPEIALTYQTVARFSTVFHDRIAIINSSLSKGEKYREFKKAVDGEVDVIIGPRSALFAPFDNLGLIIIDEEHDNAYKSETTPKYHARETAIERARLDKASVILGSATPSVQSYFKACSGEYKLLCLNERASGGEMPEVEVVDLREELMKGNKSILSEALYNRMDEAFKNGQQVMLFLNRRGYRSYVSCRKCGHVMKCPKCDVSLSLHKIPYMPKGKLVCHYCNHTEAEPQICPNCGSKLIGGFGTGTEAVEEVVRRFFPGIRTLRMDKDTTARKGAHGEIIEAFNSGKTDCLIGTQMIVKGHDFKKVTVVGAVLADLGLFDTDYTSAEKTFDLLCQAAGRAGRDKMRGHVIIQTYQPEHYAIVTAAEQNYESFFDYEMAYRKMLKFPPAAELMQILMLSKNEEKLGEEADKLADLMREVIKQSDEKEAVEEEVIKQSDEKEADAGEIVKQSDENETDVGEVIKQSDEIKTDVGERNDQTSGVLSIIGPSDAGIAKINEVYRKTIYIKASDRSYLDKLFMDEKVSKLITKIKEDGEITIETDFDPASMF